MPVISVNVRLNDRKVAVTIDTIKTIAEFKEAVHASELNIPQERQKLIYSGRVLKDEETVEKYGIQNGQTVHCVQTQAPSVAAVGTSSSQVPLANQPGQQPQQQIPTNLASGAGAFNPFAGLTGARYAGQVPLPNISMFGPDPANQLPPSPEQMQDMMNQPGFQQTMNQLLGDPRMIDYLIQSQPSLQAMGPGIRQVMQSEEFRRTMTDPTMLRNMMEMNRMFSQMGMQVPGMPGAPRQPSFPAPGITNTTASPQTQRSATPPQQGPHQNPPQANPFDAMFSPPSQQAAAPNPFAALFAPQPGAQPQQPPQPPTFQVGSNTAQPFGASYHQPSPFGSAQTQPQNPFAAAGQQQPPDLGSMISMLQSLQQFQSLFQPGQPGATPPSTSTSPPPADARPIEERFQEQLRQLNDMGFTDFNRNIAALRRTGGNVEAAIDMLISGSV